MDNSRDRVNLSIIVPIHNEESNIDHLLDRLTSVLQPLQMSYEIICINDGSTDESLAVLMKHYPNYPSLKIINLSRNFGKEIAMTAGIDYAIGDAIIPIDADLQDPPELIETLVSKWREGYDVVYAVRRSRQGESWLKRFTANNFYRVIGLITDIPIPRNTGDFRLLDRKVVDAIKLLPERRRFMKGLFSWVGFSQTAIEYDRHPRYQGKTKWNYWKLWNFALEGITSFSSSPLKIWSYIGLGISLLSFLYASFLIVRTLIFGIDLPGYASLMVVILFLGGIQLITLGIIGEYLGRVYDEVKGRPLYLVKEFHNQHQKTSNS